MKYKYKIYLNFNFNGLQVKHNINNITIKS